MPYKDPGSPQAKAYMRKRNHLYYERHKEQEKQRIKDYAMANPEIIKEQKKRHTKKYLQRELARIVAWKEKVGIEGVRQSGLAYRQREKVAFIAAYGGVCVCCGEDRFELLTADHINGRGSQERREFGSKTYAIARKQGYPKDKYRLLCWNCNASRGMYGYCPHEKEKLNFEVYGLAC